MAFYVMLVAGWKESYDIPDMGDFLFLPKVRHPVCGHELQHISALPIVVPEDAPLRRYLRPAGEQLSVPPDVWSEIERETADLLVASGYRALWIRPGMRVDPIRLVVRYRKEPPTMLPAAWFSVLRRDLVELLMQQGIRGFEAFPAEVVRNQPGGKRQPLSYDELLPLEELPLASQSELHEVRCDVCGRILERTYRALIPDTDQWQGADVITVPGGPQYLVSERVREVLAEHQGVEFIPARRVGRYPGAPSYSEISANLKFERQMQERRRHRGETS